MRITSFLLPSPSGYWTLINKRLLAARSGVLLPIEAIIGRPSSQLSTSLKMRKLWSPKRLNCCLPESYKVAEPGLEPENSHSRQFSSSRWTVPPHCHTRLGLCLYISVPIKTQPIPYRQSQAAHSPWHSREISISTVWYLCSSLGHIPNLLLFLSSSHKHSWVFSCFTNGTVSLSEDGNHDPHTLSIVLSL